MKSTSKVQKSLSAPENILRDRLMPLLEHDFGFQSGRTKFLFSKEWHNSAKMQSLLAPFTKVGGEKVVAFIPPFRSPPSLHTSLPFLLLSLQVVGGDVGKSRAVALAAPTSC